MRAPSSLLAILALATSMSALAAPCGGFDDVDSVDPAMAPFCASVDWIKNRSITLGCESNLYCPNDSVSRLQMAAFMKRLGDALIHRLVIRDQVLANLDLTSGAVICMTNPEAPAAYERRAAMSGRVSAASNAAAPSTFGVSLVFTTDDFVTLTQGGGGTAQATSSNATTWVNVAGVSSAPLDAGVTYRFGIHVQAFSGTTGLSGVSCGLSADIRPKDIND
jgi:hypothetical protein